MKAASPRPTPTTAEQAFRVVADRPGERLDLLIARACDISRPRAHRLIEDGCVSELQATSSKQQDLADGGRSNPLSQDWERVRVRAEVPLEARTTSRRPHTLKPGLKLEGGETFAVVLPPPEPAAPQAEAIPLTIVYEDEHLIVVDKPAGMPVHPGPGHSGHTLVNALLAHCPDLPGVGGVQRPGIVHRLDKDTSGLIVAAKDDRTHNALSAALKAREVHKTYLALVEGRLDPKEALIDAPIGRDPNNRRRMMVIHTGREAQTSYKVISEFSASPEGQALRVASGHASGLAGPQGNAAPRIHVAEAFQPRRPASAAVYSLIEASPITGRTHQIRVHLASVGHPVAGDPIYGHPSALVPRLFLHAWKLAFRHPITEEAMAFEAPLAADLGGSAIPLHFTA